MIKIVKISYVFDVFTHRYLFILSQNFQAKTFTTKKVFPGPVVYISSHFINLLHIDNFFFIFYSEIVPQMYNTITQNTVI